MAEKKTVEKKTAAKKTPAKKTVEKKTAAKKTPAKKTAEKRTASAAAKKVPAKKTAEKKTATAKKAPAKKTAVKKVKAETPAVKTVGMQLVELCEKVAYDRKAENITRLDMRGIEYAQSDYYLICTGLSEPHIGAIAERIQREVRSEMSIRPLLCNGDQRSGWIILDYGYAIIHVMTAAARDRYQLEELWGDAEKLDVVAMLDAEAAARREKK